MYDINALPEEEIARIKRKRAAKRKARKMRKIKGLIALIITLLLFLAVLVGIITGIIKIFKHFNKVKTSSTVNETVLDTENNVFNGNNSDENSNQGNSIGNSIHSNSDFAVAAMPYATESATYREITSESVKAPYVVLMDGDDCSILAGREYNTPIYPASLTKVMTLIVAVEHMNEIPETFTFTNDEITPHIYAGASRAGFESGETVPIEDILYGLILPSGADAATALANVVAGSEEAFAELMNKKCEELGLKYTHFTNPSGLFNENQQTTCAEMAMIMAYAMKNELCAKVLSTYQYTTTKTPQNPDGLLLTSTMFSRMYGNEVENVSIIAGKTGFTTEAGNCMVSYATKDGKGYVCVSASSTNKWHCIFDSFELYGNYLP